MEREALKLALEAMQINLTLLEKVNPHEDQEDLVSDSIDLTHKAIAKIKTALAQPAQEPVAWQTMEAKYPSLEKLDIRMGDGSILCNVWPQSDGDLWWEGSGTGEKFIDPKYANVTHWRIHAEHTAPLQRQWIWLSDADIAEVVDTTCQYTGGYEEYLIKKAERKIRSMNKRTAPPVQEPDAYQSGFYDGKKAARARCIELVLSGTGEPVQTRTLEILQEERKRIAKLIEEDGKP